MDLNDSGDVAFPSVSFQLPVWIRDWIPSNELVCNTPEERMDFVIGLATENIRRQTGGPFGAAVFERESGRLLAPGVNVVVPSHCSMTHAEVVAVSVAQQVLQHHDLGSAGTRDYELVTSAEPCAMCLGAVTWSGVKSVICGARDVDVREIGFDEGIKPPNWAGELRTRGIEVTIDVNRNAAVALLKEYSEMDGEVYNGRKGN